MKFSQPSILLTLGVSMLGITQAEPPNTCSGHGQCDDIDNLALVPGDSRGASMPSEYSDSKQPSPTKSKEFELLYRVLGTDEDSFVSSDEIQNHSGKTINLVIGMTGSGKTSMIQILTGGDQTAARTKSETQSPVLVFDKVNNLLWLDTAGMCDSSDDSERKEQLRDAILNAVKRHQFSICRIFVCVASDQNMDHKFAHEFIEFMSALPNSDDVKRIVITKVNRRKTAGEINAKGGLRAQYASAFDCPRGQVLLHGYDEFNKDVLQHAVGPFSSKKAIHHFDIKNVTKNTELMKVLHNLENQLKISNNLMNKNHSDKEHTTKKIEELYRTLESADETLDNLISNNSCGKNNGAIKRAHERIMEIRTELRINELKLGSNEISSEQASRTCDKLQFEINATKSELEARMRAGLGLADLAGAVKIFRAFFANI